MWQYVEQERRKGWRFQMTPIPSSKCTSRPDCPCEFCVRADRNPLGVFRASTEEICTNCGATSHLQFDHIILRKGGLERSQEHLVWTAQPGQAGPNRVGKKSAAHLYSGFWVHRRVYLLLFQRITSRSIWSDLLGNDSFWIWNYNSLTTVDFGSHMSVLEKS